MRKMMYFGAICQVCKRFVRLGKIETETNAPPSTLHARLQETNWQQDEAICENPKCGSRTPVTRSQTILGEPVVTSPDGVDV
jgi:hypothetical protein